MVGLGTDLDEAERPGILGHAGGQRRRRRGRAVLEGQLGLVRGQRCWRGLVSLGLISCGLISCGLIRFGSGSLGRNRVIGRDAAGLGFGHAGLGGDDRERTRMRRNDRADRSLIGQDSGPGNSGGRRGIGGARAVLTRPSCLDRASLD
jgi:hypothetical protein